MKGRPNRPCIDLTPEVGPLCPAAAPLVEATLGKELADQWFVETRVEFAYVERNYRRDARGAFPTRGTVFCPLDGVSTVLRGSWGNFKRNHAFEFQQSGAALVAGKTYGGDDWHIRPFAGYWFQKMDMMT